MNSKETLVMLVCLLSVLFGVCTSIEHHRIRDTYAEAVIVTQQINQAVMEHHLNTQRLPNRISDLVYNPGLAGWSGPYIKEKDLIDPWGNEYGYLIDHEWSEFMVYTFGRDRLPGGEDLDQDQIVAGKPRF
jgi:hypothetical protein